MSKKIACLLLVMVLVLSSAGMIVYARQPDRTFTYEGEGGEINAVPSTNVYQVKLVIDENTMGCTKMTEPTDIFVDDNDRIFVLDAGNCRVLVLDKDYRCTNILKDFVYNGEPITLKEGAKGLFFRESNQSLYIADTENNRIIVSDLQGNVSKIFEKPVDELLDPKVPYKPQKVIVDNMGIIYVTSGMVNTGAMMIDANNNFLGFFGISKLKLTAAMQLEFFWRSILTKEMNAQSSESFQPVEYYNLFWSKDRFVYAVSPVSEKVAASAVKLNALGSNVFPQNTDFVTIQSNSNAFAIQSGTNSAYSDSTLSLYLVDITVDDDGIYTILDQKSGRLFQFDENCNMLAIFGGTGYQKGLFTRPTSIETHEESNILVLDAAKNTITVMERTYYGQVIKEANRLYNEGRYTESIEPWMDVLRMNANYTQAYTGLGKAYYGLKDYEKAMEFFKNGKDQAGYAEAKAALRDETVREYFGLIAAIVIIAMIGILGYDQIKMLILRIYWRIRK